MAINLKYYIGNLVYPIGSVFVSTKNIDPANIYGGTWEEISGKMLLSNTEDMQYDEETMGSLNSPLLEHEHSLVHTHSNSTAAGAHAHTLGGTSGKLKTQNAQGYRTRGISETSIAFYYTTTAVSHTHNVEAFSGNTSTAGENVSDYTNLPPYTVVKMWKRTGLYTN